MKNLYTIMVVLAGLLCFTGCETDRDDNPTLLTPTTFVLNTPPYVSGVYDLKNTESVLFTASQPDYGFTAAVNYQVLISMENSFQEYEVLNTIYTSPRIEADAANIAVAMTRLLEDEYDEDTFPEDELFAVYVRLSATLSGANRDTIYSNIIELPKVKSYYALPPLVLPDNMYFITNATDDSWNWNNAIEMIPVNSNPGKFWRMQYLGVAEDGKDAAIKFNSTRSFEEVVGFSEAAIDAASVSRADISGNGDGDIVIGNPGWYLIVVTVSIDGRNYIYDVNFEEPNVYVIGNNPGAINAWGVFPEWRFSIPAEEDGYFVSPPFIGSGEVRLAVNLPGQAAGDAWQSEFMILDGKIEYRGAGNDQDRVNVQVGQRAYLNFYKGTGYFE